MGVVVMQPDEILEACREVSRLVESWVPLGDDERKRVTAGLRPRDEDFLAVFKPESVGRAAGMYEAFWAGEPVITCGRGRKADVIVLLGMSLWRGIEGFPKEYRHVIPHLLPRNLWACWSYRADDGAVTAPYDGLVRLDEGRWVWFPSPWLFVGDAAIVGRPSPATHWVD